MDKQKIYNKVKAHLLTQNAKSAIFKEDGNARCLYRGPNGLKCAIGCLISDETYNIDLEGYSPDNAPVQIVLRLNGIDAINEMEWRFLSNLQTIHDSNPVENWLFCLTDFAKLHNLTP